MNADKSDREDLYGSEKLSEKKGLPPQPDLKPSQKKLLVTIFLILLGAFILAYIFSIPQNSSNINNNDPPNTTSQSQANDQNSSANSSDSSSDQDIGDKNFDKTLSNYGINSKITGNTLAITGDQTTLIQNADKMKEMGILNSDISQEYINLNKTFIAGTILSMWLPEQLSEIYYNNDTNMVVPEELNVNVYLIVPDDYGNNQEHLVYTFIMPKKTAKKINWGNLDFQRITKISKNFHASKWFVEETELALK